MLKIKKRKILERFQDIIENNYQNNENTGDYSIYDPALLTSSLPNGFQEEALLCI